MDYRNIRTGQKLLLRGDLYGHLEAEVTQVDPRRIQHTGGPAGREWIIGDPIQIKVAYPDHQPILRWVNPKDLMDSPADPVQSSAGKGYIKTMKIELNADLVQVGDMMVHPATRQPHKVRSIQRSFGHRDYLDFGFEGQPFVSMWRTSMVAVIR